MPKKIIIVRHGQTDYNVRDILQGQLHVPLDKTGIAQAYKVAERLKNELVDEVFSSDLKRTLQTTDPLGKKLKSKIIPHAALRERGLGNLEGKHKDIAFKALGVHKDGFPLHHFWNFQERKEHRIFNMEPKEELFKRVDDFIDMLRRDYKGKNVLLVSHGGTIRVILKQLGFADEEYLKRLPIHNTSIIYLIKKAKGYDLEIEYEHVGIK